MKRKRQYWLAHFIGDNGTETMSAYWTNEAALDINKHNSHLKAITGPHVDEFEDGDGLRKLPEPVAEKIEMGREYRTSGGCEVRIVDTCGPFGLYPVVGYLKSNRGTWSLEKWTSDGRFEAGAEFGSVADLIPVAPKECESEPEEFWVNTYNCPDDLGVHRTKSQADAGASLHRLRCVHVREVR